jgi:pteridine reductase
MVIQNPSAAAAERVAIVTGGAVRVGRAISSKLASRGYAILIHHHGSAAEAAALADEISGAGGHALPYRADLTEPGGPRRLVEEATRLFGRLDLLVNSAALFFDDKAPLAQLARMKVLNADVPGALADLAAPLLAATRGAIVSIADVAGVVPFKGHRAYSATKKHVLSLTARKALELAGRGVRVNAVCPGAVLFPTWYPDALAARVIAGIPLGGPGAPSDVAEAVAYLADARFVTGQVLSVDGGRLLDLISRGAREDADLAAEPDPGALH